jgi:hypothetical protein
VGNGRLHYHNEVYFWPDSWAARVAPRRAPRRPGAFASAVQILLPPDLRRSAPGASSRAVRGPEQSVPVSPEASRVRPPHRLLRNRNCCGLDGGLPKLMKVRHCHSPICHRTLRILFGHALKCSFGGGVSEGVKQSHASVELFLSRWCARNRKRCFS